MKKILYSSLAAILLLSSCHKNDENSFDGNSAIKIVPTIGSLDTKAPTLDATGAGTFGTDDKVGIYVKQSSEAITTPKYVVTNDMFTVGGTNPTYYWENYGSKKLTFLGYYPYQATGITADYKFSFDVVNATEPDFLVASPIEKTYASGTATTVDLPFNHVMTKVVVNLYDGDKIVDGGFFSDGVLEGATVALNNILPSTTVNVLDGTSVASGTAGDAAMAQTAATASFSKIVAPQTVSTGAQVLTITVPVDPAVTNSHAITYKHTLASDLVFGKGQLVTLDVVLKKTDITVSLDVHTTIAAWGTGATVNIDEDTSGQGGNERKAGIYDAAELKECFDSFSSLSAEQKTKYLEGDNIIRLWADINLSSTTFSPINNFGGVLDGQGHTITTSGNKPLFSGNVSGTVCNLKCVNSSDSSSNNYLFTSGSFSGAIINCNFSTDATGSSWSFFEGTTYYYTYIASDFYGKVINSTLIANNRDEGMFDTINGGSAIINSYTNKNLGSRNSNASVLLNNLVYEGNKYVQNTVWNGSLSYSTFTADSANTYATGKTTSVIVGGSLREVAWSTWGSTSPYINSLWFTDYK